MISLSAGEPDIADDTGLTAHILDDGRVAVVQGAAHGLSPLVRLSFATSSGRLDEAISRTARFVARVW